MASCEEHKAPSLVIREFAGGETSSDLTETRYVCSGEEYVQSQE